MAILNTYTQLIKGRASDNNIPKEPEDAARMQTLSNWKNSTITKELVAKYSLEVSNLLDEAIKLAKSRQNDNKIIANLIKTDTLITIIQSYVG